MNEGRFKHSGGLLNCTRRGFWEFQFCITPTLSPPLTSHVGSTCQSLKPLPLHSTFHKLFLMLKSFPLSPAVSAAVCVSLTKELTLTPERHLQVTQICIFICSIIENECKCVLLEGIGNKTLEYEVSAVNTLLNKKCK